MDRLCAVRHQYSGALGYIEYDFDSTAGNLAPGNNSGEIQSHFANQNWAVLNELDDYSYKNSAAYDTSTHITLYRNGVLIWGTEPTPAAPVLSIKAYYQNQNYSTGSNTISTFLEINNEGNYWFTKEGTPGLNYWVDYAPLGSSKISGQFISLSQVRDSADAYFQLRVDSSAGILYPLSSTGNIQYRIAKTDWSNFNETNDYSYKPAAPFAENQHITIYYKDQLIYGTEPSGFVNMMGVSNSIIESGQAENGKPFIELYPNPVINTLSISLGKIEKEATVQVYTANGALIFTQTLFSEVNTLSAQTWVAGIYYVKIKNGDTFTIKKVLKK
jgi:hypothetical protein